jgi:uncharacterized small protein (DUF1192 family)
MVSGTLPVIDLQMGWETLAGIARRSQTDKMAMEDDDLRPLKAKPQPRNLDPMSVGELQDYIQELEAEIARVNSEIAKKRKIGDAAAALFRK